MIEDIKELWKELVIISGFFNKTITENYTIFVVALSFDLF